MKFTIEHELPGRMRLRCPEGTFSSSEAPLLTVLLQRQKGVRKAKVSPITGSLLIYYEVTLRSSVLEAVRLLDRSFYEGAGSREPFREMQATSGTFLRSMAGRVAMWALLPRPIRNSLIALRVASDLSNLRKNGSSANAVEKPKKAPKRGEEKPAETDMPAEKPGKLRSS